MKQERAKSPLHINSYADNVRATKATYDLVIDMLHDIDELKRDVKLFKPDFDKMSEEQIDNYAMAFGLNIDRRKYNTKEKMVTLLMDHMINNTRS